MVKHVVKAEQYPHEQLWKCWNLINKYHKGEFPNLCICVVYLGQTCPHLQCAQCRMWKGLLCPEQSLNHLRNRHGIEKQRNLMLIKIDGENSSTFNFNALKKWTKAKERRVYKLKKMKRFVKLLTFDWIRVHFRRFSQCNHVMMCEG